METRQTVQQQIQMIVNTAKQYVHSSYQAKAHAYHRLVNSVELITDDRETISKASYDIQRKMRL